MSAAAPAQAVDRALDLAERGEAGEALRQLGELARRHPDDPAPPRLAGALALRAGDLAAARAFLESALARAPGAPDVLSTLAALARREGDEASAEALLRQALAADPEHVPSLNNLAGLLFAQQRPALAEPLLRTALSRIPGHAPARSNLAACLLALDRGTEALAQADQAVRAAPGYAPAWQVLGQVQLARGEFELAQSALERALALGADGPDTHYALAQALDEQGHWPQALAAAERALAQDPDLAPALSLAQYLARRLCRHEALAARHARLLALLDHGAEGIAPFAFLSEEAGPDAQRRAAGLAAAAVARRVEAIDGSAVAPAAVGGADGPLRVGFVSSGFGQHPTALLVVEMLEHLHRHPGIETIGFATTPDDGGPLRRRLASAFHGLHDLSGLANPVMAQRLAAQRLDVLVDLRGWGGGSVADVLARRPAPLQVNWLAYPGTSGAPWIDWLIADRFVLPDQERGHYSEAVLRLPHCFQPSDSTRLVGEPPPRGALGLPERGVVFACFNNSYKYSPESVQRFWRVLAGVPDSVLWLLAGRQPAVADNLRRAAAAAGIDPDRLVFAAKQPHAAYLAGYRHACLFLDTTPYNAHTTASDALWAGCPVLTLPGRTFASRVAGSLNACLGLDAMNAGDDDDFVARAIALGRDPALLAAIRADLALARDRAPLFDMAGFARDFERALRAMVERSRAGLAPADLDLEPQP
ncbi:MAG: tetratricopeptide repeat protein [Xanthomonadales bacterium]|nr:tetratricopeptide repeat protein [Xanthomonadales bacterium]